MTITVTDNGSPAAASDSEVVTITVGNVNRPPVLTAIGTKTATEGQLLTFTATATDPDGDTRDLLGREPADWGDGDRGRHLLLDAELNAGRTSFPNR